jgi:hypothetical protein
MSEEQGQQLEAQGDLPQETSAASEENTEPTVYESSTQAAELAEKEAQVASLQQDLESKVGLLSDLQSKVDGAVEDPTAFLESLGLDYAQITDHYLRKQGNVEPTESEIVLQKLGDLESKIAEESENRQKYVEQQTAAQQQQTYGKAVAEVKEYVDNNSEEFDLVTMHNAADVVLSVIGENYQKTGEVLELQEACRAVQEHYEDEAKRYLASDKTLEKLGLKRTATNRQAGNQDRAPQTLSNNIGTKAPRYSEDRQMTRDESLEYAASLLRWE